jgi:hypothetical protein
MSNNPLFSTEQCVAVQRQCAIAADSEGLTVMQAYRIAEKVLKANRPVGHPAGFCLDANNKLKRIKGSIPKEDRRPASDYEPPSPVVVVVTEESNSTRGRRG